MNRQLVIGAVVGALAVTTVGAVAGYRMMDQKQFATVLSVKAATRYVNVPRETCHNETVTVEETLRKCQTVMDRRSEPAGYDVVYRYEERDETIRMSYDPGRQIPMENGSPVFR